MKDKALARPGVEWGSQELAPPFCYRNGHEQAVYLLPKKVTSTLKGVSENYEKLKDSRQ